MKPSETLFINIYLFFHIFLVFEIFKSFFSFSPILVYNLDIFFFNNLAVLFIYFTNKTVFDFRRYLRETLKMANAEDLNRLTSCSLVLLGHIFLSINNSRESMNMVTPAMQLASKIPDVHVQLWASAILKGMIIFKNTVLVRLQQLGELFK